jgi:hypothetical protein
MRRKIIGKRNGDLPKETFRRKEFYRHGPSEISNRDKMLSAKPLAHTPLHRATGNEVIFRGF